MNPKFGVAIAMSAVAVNGPLLAEALLHADRVPISLGWTIALATTRTVAMVTVLSLGAAFIAHAAAEDPASRIGLVLVWLAVLAGTAFIVTPVVFEAVGKSLAQTLPTTTWRWIWSAVSVVTVEVAAAGCMLAARSARNATRAAQLREAPSEPRELGRAERLVAQPGSRLAAQSSELIELGLSPKIGAPGKLPCDSEKAEHSPPSTASLPVEAVALNPSYACSEGCGRTFKSRRAAAGHLRACPLRKRAGLEVS